MFATGEYCLGLAEGIIVFFALPSIPCGKQVRDAKEGGGGNASLADDEEERNRKGGGVGGMSRINGLQSQKNNRKHKKQKQVSQYHCPYQLSVCCGILFNYEIDPPGPSLIGGYNFHTWCPFVRPENKTRYKLHEGRVGQ